MYSERLQLLLSPDQRRRLEHEAAVTGRSVASLVREAIDAVYDVTPAADRESAVATIASLHGDAPADPEQLRDLIDASHDDEILGP